MGALADLVVDAGDLPQLGDLGELTCTTVYYLLSYKTCIILNNMVLNLTCWRKCNTIGHCWVTHVHEMNKHAKFYPNLSL